MTTTTITLPRPHPAQAQILTEAARFNVIALGRRAGKSTLGQHQLIHTALGARPAGYFAPTYKLLADFWRELRSTVEPVTRSKSEQDHRLELVTGGVIECWSLDDPNPARGRKYARVVVDEAAMVPNLMDIWQLAIRPTLTDFEGDAWFLSTPRGLNDFWLLWQAGQDPHQRHWRSWQMPTSVNPYINPDEIEAARLELPERAYAQEYAAEFLQLGGAAVFRGVQAVSRLKPASPVRGRTYVMGIDWGRSNDFTVFSIIDASTREQVAMDRMTEIDYELQTERLHEWASVYRPRAIVAEANSMGRPLIERLQYGYARLLGSNRPPLPVQAWTATNATKAQAVQQLSLAIEQGLVTLLDDPVQTGELLAYELTVLPSGMLRYSAPDGGHDDTVTALYLAWLAAAADAMPTTKSGYAFASRNGSNGRH